MTSTRPPQRVDHFCAEADFVFNLAGVNRPKNNDEFMQGNFGFASTLLDTLKSHANRCPVMLSSSIQATLIGRYGESDYGKSKLAGEELFFTYGAGDRRAGAGLPLPESVRQVVPPQLQQRRGDLLQ